MRLPSLKRLLPLRIQPSTNTSKGMHLQFLPKPRTDTTFSARTVVRPAIAEPISEACPMNIWVCMRIISQTEAPSSPLRTTAVSRRQPTKGTVTVSKLRACGMLPSLGHTITTVPASHLRLQSAIWQNTSSANPSAIPRFQMWWLS